MPTVTLHMVTSLDGFIARHDNSVSWLDPPNEIYEAGIADEDANIAKSPQQIDCYIIGARTYELALKLGWPYGQTPTVVLSHQTLSFTRETVEFYRGDLTPLINKNLADRFQNIWLAGGANVHQQFLQLGLVDHLNLMIAPITLGQGKRLFNNQLNEQRWQLTNVVAYKTGFVELSYKFLSTPTSM